MIVAGGHGHGSSRDLWRHLGNPDAALVSKASLLLDNGNQLLATSNQVILTVGDTPAHLNATLDQVGTAFTQTALRTPTDLQAFRAFTRSIPTCSPPSTASAVGTQQPG